MIGDGSAANNDKKGIETSLLHVQARTTPGFRISRRICSARSVGSENTLEA